MHIKNIFLSIIAKYQNSKTVMVQFSWLTHHEDKASYRPYIYASLSSFSLVVMQLAFKQLTAYASPPFVLAFRGSLLFFFNLYLLERSGLDFNVRCPRVFRMLLKRSIVNYIGVTLYICSLKYMPLGIANALHNTSPIMAFFIELCYYKKTKINWLNLVIILVCFSGILFIIQPQFLFPSKSHDTVTSSTPKIFYLFVLTAAFTNSLSMIFLHDLKDKCHQLIALQYMYMFQSCFNYTFFTAFIGTSQQSYQKFHTLSLQKYLHILVFVLIMFVFAYLAQYMRVRSVYMCSPALIMPFNYLTVIFGLLFDVLVFGAHYDWKSIIGMALASAGLLSKFILLKFQGNKIEQK